MVSRTFPICSPVSYSPIPCNSCPASSGVDPSLTSHPPSIATLAASQHTRLAPPSVVPSCSAIYCTCTHTPLVFSLTLIYCLFSLFFFPWEGFLCCPPLSGFILLSLLCCCRCCLCLLLLLLPLAFCAASRLDVQWKTLSQSTFPNLEPPDNRRHPTTTDIPW